MPFLIGGPQVGMIARQGIHARWVRLRLMLTTNFAGTQTAVVGVIGNAAAP
jgi:hypothetical protein